jgi:hypothetical protein
VILRNTGGARALGHHSFTRKILPSLAQQRWQRLRTVKVRSDTYPVHTENSLGRGIALRVVVGDSRRGACHMRLFTDGAKYPRCPSDNADIAHVVQDMSSIRHSVHSERSWGFRESLARGARSFLVLREPREALHPRLEKALSISPRLYSRLWIVASILTRNSVHIENFYGMSKSLARGGAGIQVVRRPLKALRPHGRKAPAFSHYLCPRPRNTATRSIRYSVHIESFCGIR